MRFGRAVKSFSLGFLQVLWVFGGLGSCGVGGDVGSTYFYNNQGKKVNLYCSY